MFRNLYYKSKDLRWKTKNRLYAVKHGHFKSDPWNIDWWFLRNMIVFLDRSIELNYSIPTSVHGKWNNETRDYDPREDGKDPADAWKEILIEMREGFQEWLDHDSMKHFENYKTKPGEWQKIGEEKRLKLNRSLDLFKQHFSNLWD
jgi:hypothetical protein